MTPVGPESRAWRRLHRSGTEPLVGLLLCCSRSPPAGGLLTRRRGFTPALHPCPCLCLDVCILYILTYTHLARVGTHYPLSVSTNVNYTQLCMPEYLSVSQPVTQFVPQPAAQFVSTGAYTLVCTSACTYIQSKSRLLFQFPQKKSHKRHPSLHPNLYPELDPGLPNSALPSYYFLLLLSYFLHLPSYYSPTTRQAGDLGKVTQSPIERRQMSDGTATPNVTTGVFWDVAFRSRTVWCPLDRASNTR